MNVTKEQREVGRDNYYSAVTKHDQVTRREFLAKSSAAAVGTVGGVSALGAMYFGYDKPGKAIRVCVIGTGDEGNVLMGAISPEYVEVKAICDIRPSSFHRAMEGDWSSGNTIKARPGLKKVYGWNDKEAAKVKRYTDWREAVKDPDIDAVIIATPLFLHAPMAIAAMQAGKHVLCEKLMAHNVAQCKLMTRVAEETGMTLSVGHQRHYSILYDNAVNLIQWGLLGEIHHIRAQWHRNNAPGTDSWALPIPGGEIGADGKVHDRIIEKLEAFEKAYARSGSAGDKLKLSKQIAQWKAWDQDKTVDAAKHGYISRNDVYSGGRTRSAIEEMVRWRLWDRTGGGLMAELGSHQLDAASIFISSLAKETGKHVHPLTVYALGGRHIFPEDRDADDHVYCSFEFPGQGYDYNFDIGYKDKVNNYPNKSGVPSFEQDSDKKVVVTYSSINGNGFGGYGEVVMGTKATLMIDREKEVMIWPTKNLSYKAGVKELKGGGAVLDTAESGDAGPAKTVEGSGPVSRGYREQIEHWAWCISTGDKGNQPRCNGPVALADAVIALTTKQAIANSHKKGGNGFMEFQPEWFDYKSDAVPESVSIEETKKQFAMEKKNMNLA